MYSYTTISAPTPGRLSFGQWLLVVIVAALVSALVAGAILMLVMRESHRMMPQPPHTTPLWPDERPPHEVWPDEGPHEAWPDGHGRGPSRSEVVPGGPLSALDLLAEQALGRWNINVDGTIRSHAVVAGMSDEEMKEYAKDWNDRLSDGFMLVEPHRIRFFFGGQNRAITYRILTSVPHGPNQLHLEWVWDEPTAQKYAYASIVLSDDRDEATFVNCPPIFADGPDIFVFGR